MEHIQACDDISRPLVDYFTVQDIVSALGNRVSESHLYLLINTGKLAVYPGTKLIPVDVAVDFILDGARQEEGSEV